MSRGTPPLLVALLFALSSCGSEEADLVVYASLDQAHSEPILRLFEERTGLRVEAQYDVEQNKTVGLVNRLIAEKQRPYADVFWNNEIAHTIRLKQQGLTQPSASAATQKIPPAFRDADGHWTGFAARARVILYRRDLLDRAGLKDPPNEVLAMNRPPFAADGAMAAPLTGTTLTHFAALTLALGDQAVADWLRQARTSLAITSGNATAMRRVCQGDLAWCLTDTDDAAAAVANGYPVEILYPDQSEQIPGTLLIPNTVCMIRNARHPAAAQQFIDFLVSPEVEEMLAQSRSRQIPLHPDSVPPADLPLPGKDYAVWEVDWARVADALERNLPTFQEIFVD